MSLFVYSIVKYFLFTLRWTTHSTCTEKWYADRLLTASSHVLSFDDDVRQYAVSAFSKKNPPKGSEHVRLIRYDVRYDVGVVAWFSFSRATTTCPRTINRATTKRVVRRDVCPFSGPTLRAENYEKNFKWTIHSLINVIRIVSFIR